jgi:hypothetical protein
MKLLVLTIERELWPQRLKPDLLGPFGGTAEAVPFPIFSHPRDLFALFLIFAQEKEGERCKVNCNALPRRKICVL